MAVSKRLRYEILRRDQFKCRYCNAAPPDVKLVVDHVMPKALGGTDEPTNLVTACQPCNSGKTSSTPDAHLVADVHKDALRWGQAMQQAVEQARAKRDEMDRYQSTFKTAWHQWRLDGSAFELPGDWRISLDRFYVAGLPDWMLPQIVDKAMSQRGVTDRFKYACGIAWKEVTQLQNEARAIVTASGDQEVEWDEREAEVVCEAAVYVWRSFWMVEHQAKPEPELLTQVRASAHSLYPEVLNASQLMRIAAEAGEGWDSTDLTVAYENTDSFDGSDGLAGSELTDWYLNAWVDGWREREAQDPPPHEVKQAALHIRALTTAGYENLAIRLAIFKASKNLDPEISKYATTAKDAYDFVVWSEERRTLPEVATNVWLAVIKKHCGEEWLPRESDIPLFTRHVADIMRHYSTDDVLDAAQMAGMGADHSLLPHLPELKEEEDFDGPY